MKKIIFILFLFLVPLLFPRLSFAGAVDTTVNEITDCLDGYIKSGKVASCVHVFNIQDAGIYWGNCRLGGVACPSDDKDSIPYLKKSVLGQTASAITYLYQSPPAQTSQFIAYYGQKMGIVKPAYAQTTGIGFSGLKPLMGLWIVFRNVAYGFLILVMIVIGFMILFRAKIDPRTVISIQSAIPRIIVTLFLVTFSYAICGLLIDLMYLLLFLAISIINTGYTFKGQNALTTMITNYSGGSLWTIFGAVWTSGMGAVEEIVKVISPFGSNVTNAASIIATTLGGLLIGGGITVGGGIGAVVGLIVGAGTTSFGYNPIVSLLIILAIVFSYIRIFLMLLNAYVGVLLSVIIGPLQIMLGAIPNSNSFSSWLKNMIANLAVFPVTAIMLMLGSILSAITVNANNQLWTPPGLSGQNFSEGIAGLIGLGITFAIPSVANALKEALKVKPIIPTGASAVFSPITSVYQTAMGGISQVYYLKNMFPGKGKKP